MSNNLFPIVVPKRYFSRGNFPSFHKQLRHPELAVTWVELTSKNSMIYVNFERHQEIEMSGNDVHSLAMSHLRSSEFLTTHEKMISDRCTIHIMMHDDGLGSSRLLLISDLDEVFPEGYWLAIPERSCGIVVPKSINAEDRETVENFVEHLYCEGSTAMLPGLLDRSEFEILDR